MDIFVIILIIAGIAYWLFNNDDVESKAPIKISNKMKNETFFQSFFKKHFPDYVSPRISKSVFIKHGKNITESGYSIPNGLTEAIWLLENALRGNKFAEYHLGNLVWYGHGIDRVPISQTLAVALYLSSALQGFDKAQFAVGNCYETGFDDIPANMSLAFTYYKKAAAQNHLDAHYFLFRCYFFGVGTSQNTYLALKCLENYARLKGDIKCLEVLPKISKAALEGDPFILKVINGMNIHLYNNK